VALNDNTHNIGDWRILDV